MPDPYLALIRFVTSRHGDLQGLRDAAFAVCVIGMMGLIVWVDEAPAPWGSVIVLVAWMLAAEGSARLVDSRYAACYGRVDPAQPGVLRSTRTQMLRVLVSPST